MSSYRSHRPGRLWLPERGLVLPRRGPEILVRTPEISAEPSVGMGIMGVFPSIQLIRRGVVIQEVSMPNLIVNTGLDALGDGPDTGDMGVSVTSQMGHFAVGTGSTLPSATQVGLVNEVGRTSANGGFGDAFGAAGDGSYWFYRRTRLFLEAEVNANLTEIGIFRYARNQAGDLMWARQLFRDEAGNAVTITKTSEDQLKIVYEVRIYPYLTRDTKVMNFNIRGVQTSHTITSGAQRTTKNEAWGYYNPSSSRAGGALYVMGYWDKTAFAGESNLMPIATGDMGLTGAVSNYSGNEYQGTIFPYVGGSFQREIEVRWEPAIANSFATGIGNAQFNPWWYQPFVSVFDPKIQKTNNDRLILRYKVTWSRL